MLFSSGIRRAVDQYGSTSTDVRLEAKRAQLRRRHTCSVLEQASAPISSSTNSIAPKLSADQQNPLPIPIQPATSSRQVSFLLPESREELPPKPSTPTHMQRPLSSCLIRSTGHGSPRKKALIVKF
jgi:hypothetical protein